MGSIFGFTLLNKNRMSKDSLITLTTELVRGQLGQVNTVNLAITSSDCIAVLQKDMSIDRFIASLEFKNFINANLRKEKVYSLIGSTTCTTYNNKEEISALSVIKNTVSVSKDTFFEHTGNGVDVVSEIVDNYEYGVDTTNRIKQVAKDVTIYAAVNAFYPDVLLLGKHTSEPLKLSMFAGYGIFMFSSMERGIKNVTSQLILGKEENVELFSNEAFVLNMQNNTFKVSNIFIGTKNYAAY